MLATIPEEFLWLSFEATATRAALLMEF